MKRLILLGLACSITACFGKETNTQDNQSNQADPTTENPTEDSTSQQSSQKTDLNTTRKEDAEKEKLAAGEEEKVTNEDVRVEKKQNLSTASSRRMGAKVKTKTKV